MNQVYLIIAVVHGKMHFGNQKPEKRRFAAILNQKTVRLHRSIKLIPACVNLILDLTQ